MGFSLCMTLFLDETFVVNNLWSKLRRLKIRSTDYYFLSHPFLEKGRVT